MKIWGRANSANVQKVMWAVAETGIPHQRIDAGGSFGKLDTPEFAAMNPNRLVPVMDDDGFILWESNTIVRYLAGTYGGNSIEPTGRNGHVLASQWMDWTASTIQPDIIGTCFIGLIRTPAATRHTAAIEAAAKRAGENLGHVDRLLASRPFLLGDKLTSADIPLGTLMFRYFTLPLSRPSLPNVEAWYARLTARAPYRDHVMVDYDSLKVPGA